MTQRYEILDWVERVLVEEGDNYFFRRGVYPSASQDRGGYGIIIDVEGDRFVLDVRRA